MLLIVCLVSVRVNRDGHELNFLLVELAYVGIFLPQSANKMYSMFNIALSFLALRHNSNRILIERFIAHETILLGFFEGELEPWLVQHVLDGIDAFLSSFFKPIYGIGNISGLVEGINGHSFK